MFFRVFLKTGPKIIHQIQWTLDLNNYIQREENYKSNFELQIPGQ